MSKGVWITILCAAVVGILGFMYYESAQIDIPVEPVTQTAGDPFMPIDPPGPAPVMAPPGHVDVKG